MLKLKFQHIKTHEVTKDFQKISNEIEFKDGFYHPKYSGKRKGIFEEDFIDKINKSQLRKSGYIDEHQLIDQFQIKAGNTAEIIQYRILADHECQQTNNLLFYHWYERKYNNGIINNDILYTLNISSIIPWYDKFSKKEISPNIYEKLNNHLTSDRFPDFSIYYEYFHDFFPNIDKFTFEEFQQKEFLNYLLELFPKIVAINYKNQKNLWRITKESSEFYGDDGNHGSVKYNNYNLPCFHPSIIGEKNHNYYKIGLSEVFTPLCIIIKSKIRNIENEIREERGLPKIGEGWISETLLYYKIKKTFEDYHVVQHGKPSWLGLQHFDIFMPELNIAIEYQGTQHQKPVDYFGGEIAFEKGQERDIRKKRLCEENGCFLFYVYPDDDIEKFLKEMKKKIIELKKEK